MLFIILFLNPEYYSGSVIYNTHVPNLTAYHVQPKNIRLGAMVTSLLFYFSNNHNGYGYLVTFVTFCTFCTFCTFTTFPLFRKKYKILLYLVPSFFIHNS